MSVTVTAAQGGSTANGILLRVLVLTGTAAVQNGGSAIQSGAAPHQATVTTTVTGSQVYCAANNGSALTGYTPNANTTTYDEVADSANAERYVTGRTTAATGTPGAISVGWSAPSGGGGCACAEILPSGLITEDSSAPATVTNFSGTTVTTAAFSPPPGALLVALVSADGGSGVTTMALSGAGLTWVPLAESNGSAQDYAGVWIGQVPGSDNNDPVITATQGSSTANGMALRVKILLGAAVVQNGATATQTGAAAHQASITTTVTGSFVYGAMDNGSGATSFTPNASTTMIDDVADSTNAEHYGTCRSTSATGTPGAITIGASAPSGGGGFACVEILPAAGQSITEDLVNGPAVATTTSATTVSTAAFNATPGSLLVAMVAADGGASVETMTVSGGGLTWTEAVKSNGSAQDYAGVWLAQVPPAAPGGAAAQYGPGWHPGAGLPGVPGGTPFLSFPDLGGAIPAAPSALAVAYPRPGPVQARQLSASGGRVTRRAGAYGGTGPAVKSLPAPAQARRLPARGGSVSARAGAFGGTGPVLRALFSAISARLRVLPPRGRTAGRAGPQQGTGPALTPPRGPVQARRLPQRGGSTASRAGTFTLVITGSGPPVYPLGHPATARRLPARSGSVTRRAGPQQGTGPPVPALKQPLGVSRQQPPPPARGRVMSLHGTPQGSGPAAIPLRRPVRSRWQAPLLTGRAAATRLPVAATPPPAFTVGTMTAADKATAQITAATTAGTLTGATVPGSILTAATAVTSTLTATDQRTAGAG